MDWPSYLFSVPFVMLALPSMKIVPFRVSVFVVAFHRISPIVVRVVPGDRLARHVSRRGRPVDAAGDGPGVRAEAAGDVHLLVVDPDPERAWSGSRQGDATDKVVWLALIAPESVVLAPGPTRQMYEVAGVSSKVPRLLFRFG